MVISQYRDPISGLTLPMGILAYSVVFVVGMGVFYILIHYVHGCCAFLWSTFLIFSPKLFGIDGDEQVEHAREVLDVPVSEGLPHGDGITGDE